MSYKIFLSHLWNFFPFPVLSDPIRRLKTLTSTAFSETISYFTENGKIRTLFYQKNTKLFDYIHVFRTKMNSENVSESSLLRYLNRLK